MADTVFSVIRAAAESDPGRVAIQAPGRRATTYASLIALVEAQHATLARHDIGRNTRVATVLPGGAETAVAVLVLATGATCVPLNPAYTTDELAGFVAATRAEALLTTRALAPHVRQVAERFALPVILLEPDTDATAGCFRLDFAGLPERPRGEEQAEADNVALVLHTSGSTAEPKIVPLTQQNLVASMGNLVASLSLGPDDVCLNMMPLFHVGALVDLLFAPLSVGGSVVVTPTIASATFFDCLTAFRPTWYQGVPTMLQDILGLASDNLKPGHKTKLRFVRAVSSPLPRKVEQEVEAALGAPVVAIYGMTETAGVIASNPLPPAARKHGSVGKPIGCTVMIADGEGNPVGTGQRGEVIVSGDNVMAGYESAEDNRRQSLFGKWLRTGDEGYFDADGFLFLTGRIKEIINRGGEKISPRQIDECLAELAGVREAAACPVPHPTLGEDVAVAVVVEPGAELTEQAIVDHLAARLSRFKVPHRIAFLDALPRLPSGKLDRRMLAAAVEDGGAGGAGRRGPTGPLEKLLTELWTRVLDVQAIGVDDNFFDLGGDSLKATTLVMTLEGRLGREVPPGILFDAPTVAELAASLSAAGLDSAPRTETRHMPVSLYRSVSHAIAGWKGARATPDSLLVGRNTLGTKLPLFWAFTAESEFVEMAAHLDPDRPLYAMRSLAFIGRKAERQHAPLADYYAEEILRVQSEGPYLIGGFCEGGRLAFDLATRLRATGHKVPLLALHDGFVPAAYDGEVAVFWSDSYWSLAPDVARAERGWNKYYTGPLSVVPWPVKHEDTYVEPAIASWATRLEAEFARVEEGAPPTGGRRYPDARPLDSEAYRARLSAPPLSLQWQGRDHTVSVVVRNMSPVGWQPTAASGISVGACWRNLNQRVYANLAARAELTEPLAPGETRAFTLSLAMPRNRPMFLDIDLLEEGVCWFHERGSRRHRTLVLPLPSRASVESVEAA